MKLLLIITDYGSFNNFLSELATTISKMPGFELHVICSRAKIININDKDVFENGNVTFHFVDIPRRITLLGEWLAAKKIYGVVNDIKPDLVHIHFTTASLPSLLLKNKRIKYWATIHGLGMNASTGFKKVMFTAVEMFCFSRLDRIFVVNDQDFRLVSKYFKDKVKKYDCLGFGCDTDRFQSENVSVATRDLIRNKYRIEDHHRVIAFTGRFVSFKGFHLVIKSFKVLSERFPGQFKLVLMGGRDPIHQTGLDEAETDFLENNGDIINVGFSSNVEQYLAVTDIFLFPSVKEGLPTCTLEALAMGVPVISFNTRGNNDIIRDGYNGLLVQAVGDIRENVKNIVDAVTWMTEHEDRRIEFKNNALQDRYAYSRRLFIDEQLRYYNSGS